MSGYLHFRRTGVCDVDAVMSALERAGNLFHHTEQWGDGYPNEGDPSPLDGVQSALDSLALRARPQPARDLPICTEHQREIAFCGTCLAVRE